MDNTDNNNKQDHYKRFNGHKNKFHTELCSDNLTFQDCELEILRNAVDETEKLKGKKMANNEEIKNILSILENFLIKKKLVCYGGTAINNILPASVQFYDRDLEIPDYDFYSPDAVEDAKELADIYFKEGYLEIEAKAGVHFGTYKVFVNFIPIADITYLNRKLFTEIFKDSIKINGIHYAPANFLRMNMYLELSRPTGDVSRWEKVLKRLTLLNQFYPLNPRINCSTIDFQRKMDSNTHESDKLYYTVRDAFINQGVVFFGGYASSLYSRYMPKNERRIINKIPDFDVLSEDPDRTAIVLKELLQPNYKQVFTIKHEAIGEIIPERIELRVGKETLAFIYKPIACHSYNIIQRCAIDNSLKMCFDNNRKDNNSQEIKVATIDTILSFYLAFTYAGEPYYNKDRLLCMSKFLFDVEQKNRLEQKGLLKRFSIDCYGNQKTLEEIRSEKTKKFKELIQDRNSVEYTAWFLKYNPLQKKNVIKPIKLIKTNTDKSRSRSRSRSRNKPNSRRKTRSNSKYLI
jgi:hypothetical protein